MTFLERYTEANTKGEKLKFKREICACIEKSEQVFNKRMQEIKAKKIGFRPLEKKLIAMHFKTSVEILFPS